MTRPDFGSERPDDASETRRQGALVQSYASEPMPMSGRKFIVALIVIAAALALATLLFR